MTVNPAIISRLSNSLAPYFGSVDCTESKLHTFEIGSKKSLPIYQKLVNAMAHSRDNLEILLRYAYALDANSRNEEANVIYRRLYSLNPRDLRVSPLLSSGTSRTFPKPNSSL